MNGVVNASRCTLITSLSFTLKHAHKNSISLRLYTDDGACVEGVVVVVGVSRGSVMTPVAV